MVWGCQPTEVECVCPSNTKPNIIGGKYFPEREAGHILVTTVAYEALVNYYYHNTLRTVELYRGDTMTYYEANLIGTLTARYGKYPPYFTDTLYITPELNERILDTTQSMFVWVVGE